MSSRTKLFISTNKMKMKSECKFSQIRKSGGRSNSNVKNTFVQRQASTGGRLGLADFGIFALVQGLLIML